MVAALLLATVLPALAVADEASAPKMPKPRVEKSIKPAVEPVSAPAFGAQNSSCLEWTDTCRVCVRQTDEIHCSTPGPACLPQALVCTRTR